MNLEELNSKIADELDASKSQNQFEIAVTTENVISTLESLHKEGFNVLIDLFCVDYPQRKNRIELIYIIRNLFKNAILKVKLSVPLYSTVPSVTKIFSSANWCEREAFDMFGVNFTDHPNLERLLTDYGFEGHPMLKDFPLTGYKEVRYDMKSGEVIYEDVNLSQSYRNFDFLTPWQGTAYVKDNK